MLQGKARDNPLRFTSEFEADEAAVRGVLTALVAAYPHGLFVTDGKGVLVACNARLAVLLALDTDALLGQPLEQLVAALAPRLEDSGRLRTHVAAQLARGGAAEATPLQLDVIADGDEPARRLLLEASTAQAGRTAWSVIDVSQAETCDAQVGALQARLLQSEKMAALGNLVAGIAHEINTPVGAIGSMHGTLRAALTKLRAALEQRLAKPLDEDAQLRRLLAIVEESNRVVADGVERVTTLVRRLRSFARLDDDELLEADLEEALEDTLLLLHHELKYGIEVLRDFGGVPKVACYPGQLKQVFLNLLVNARQALGERGGRITVSTRCVDDTIQISVADDGPGIAPEHLPRLFDAGFTTKGLGVGTGLGLAICQQIATRHRGRIEVESECCQGACFTLVLPLDLRERCGCGDAGRDPA